MAVDTQERWMEIRKIHVEWATGYRLLGGLVLVLIGIWIGSLLFAQQQGYDMNLYTEIMGVVVTVAIIDTFNRRRDERRREDDLKARLVREAASMVNDTAVRAVEELRALGWLAGDNGVLARVTLRRANFIGADLERANLAGTNLSGANLEGAALVGANLAGTNLSLANLKGANLSLANLEGANLFQVILEGADLRLANLKGAALVGASLEGADLSFANLEGATLTSATFDEKTLLPDAVWDRATDQPTLNSYYQPSVTDMGKYTDPDHVNADGNLDFWRDPLV